MSNTVFEQHEHLGGSFVAERDEKGVRAGVWQTDDPTFELHMLCGSGDGILCLGISQGDGPIMGVIMSPEAMEKHIEQCRRFLALARGEGKGTA